MNRAARAVAARAQSWIRALSATPCGGEMAQLVNASSTNHRRGAS